VSNQSRGIYLERAVMDVLHDHGWTVIRSAGSHGAADVVGVKPGVCVFIQSKMRLALLGSREWTTLWDLSQKAGAVPIVAYRPSPRTMAFSRILGPRALRERAADLLSDWSPA
jgi:Holliday junction resolvase